MSWLRIVLQLIHMCGSERGLATLDVQRGSFVSVSCGKSKWPPKRPLIGYPFQDR